MGTELKQFIYDTFIKGFCKFEHIWIIIVLSNKENYRERQHSVTSRNPFFIITRNIEPDKLENYEMAQLS